MPSNLPFQLRHDERDRLSGAGAGRDHIDGGRTRAAQVLMRQVEDLLIIGITVDRRHETLLNAEGIVDDFGGGRQTIGCARRVRQDMM